MPVSVERHDVRGLDLEPRGGFVHPHAGDHEVGGNLGERREHESPVEQFGMGQRQPFGVQRNIVIGDEVDVDDARPPALGGRAAELDLERLDPFEQRLRLKAGQAEGAGVDEPVLIGLAPGRGAVEAGDGGERKCPARRPARGTPS